MANQRFVDRDDELEFLESRFESESSELLVAGECKYTSREMTEGDLADLERTASQVQWTPAEKGDREEHYCCFCRSGFSDGLQQVATNRDDVSLFTPADIIPSGVTG